MTILPNGVILEGCADYQEADARLRALVRSFDIRWDGRDVFVKPNIAVSDPTRSGPDSAVVTHPLFVRPIVCELISLGASVSIGDIGVGDVTYDFIGVTGIEQALKGTGAKFIPFSEFEPVRIPNPLAPYVHIAKPILDADIVVNLPKLKTHGLTMMTGAVKNLYGCVSHEDRKSFHRIAKTPDEFGSILADIYSTISPKLTLMDAIVAMEGNGPISGLPKDGGMVLAGTDGFSIDAIASKLIGCPVYAVPTTRAAVRNYSFSIPDIVLDDSFIVKDFRLHDAHHSRFIHSGKCLLLPEIDASRCTGCQDCSRNCPSQAISMVSGKPAIDFSRCMLCYCCNEVCRSGACGLAKAFPVCEGGGKPLLYINPTSDDLHAIAESLPLELVSVHFRIPAGNFNGSTGKIILDFLNNLKRKKVPFQLISPLPRCLFKVGHSLASKYFPPLSCEKCPKLRSLSNGISGFCEGSNAKLMGMPSGNHLLLKPRLELPGCSTCRFQKGCYGPCLSEQ